MAKNADRCILRKRGKLYKCSALEHRLYNKKQITKSVISLKLALQQHSTSSSSPFSRPRERINEPSPGCSISPPHLSLHNAQYPPPPPPSPSASAVQLSTKGVVAEVVVAQLGDRRTGAAAQEVDMEPGLAPVRRGGGQERLDGVDVDLVAFSSRAACRSLSCGRRGGR
uniref:Uncharacterized protein n=1 Tax=Oryza sativa subsp. japonica TaxID=39947 RepID=Q5SNM9_ORYSJ|nr:hypothetical protein [Oryza sativa Japonica Group]